MNAIKNTIKYMLSAGLLTASLTSCDSFLKEYSQDLAKVEGWEDLDELLIGQAYYQTGKDGYAEDGGGTGENLNFLHVMTDEMYLPNTYDKFDPEGARSYFAYYTWQKDTGVNQSLKYYGGDESIFNKLYSKINICNMVLGQIDAQPENSQQDAVEKQRVKGEAYFLRACYYFMLTNIYCEPYDPATAADKMGMPIKFSEYIEDAEFKRDNLKNTYAKILEDLDNAETHLQGTTPHSVYRTSLAAAKLLHARAYLYMQDYANAAKKAQEVLDINSNLLDLRSKTAGEACLYASNPEMLLTMGDYTVATFFQNRKSSYYRTPCWLLTDYIYDLYTRNDMRRTLYIGKAQYGNVDHVFRKYNGQHETYGNYYDASSNFTFRTSEAYLILAEAAAFNGDESLAKSTLETFLAKRMNGTVTVTETGNDLIDFISDERTREFLLEGHRWFDLRRYTVCQKYPRSKEIEHPYPYFADMDLDYVDWYRLEKDDAAYTLSIPRSVLQFQVSLGSVSRPDRVPFKTE